MGRLLRVGEVAALTRVSVRTLHHYDRIGLVRPAARSAAGYRLYAAGDLLRLQQVLTLRYLGFPLAKIGALLARPDFDVVASLRIQRGALRDRIAELGRIEAALDRLVEHRLGTGEWAWELVVEASGAAGGGLAHGGTEMEHYYTPEQMERFEELRTATPPEEIAAVEEGWAALLAEIRANHDLDPASARARDLVDRWDALLARTMRGFGDDPGLREAIAANYTRGAFEGEPRAPQVEDFAFVERVKAAGAAEAGSDGA